MSDNQFSILFFFIVGIVYVYKGLALLFQSLRQEQYVIWYKRSKLPKSFSYILLGLGLIITTGILFTGILMPLGTIGWGLIFVFLEVPMILFGVLAWWNKSHSFSKRLEEKSIENAHLDT